MINSSIFVKLEDFNRILNFRLTKSDILIFAQQVQEFELPVLIGAPKYYEIVNNLTDYETLLNGGTFEECGSTVYFHGLKTWLVYKAYSNFIVNHQTQLIEFGVSRKQNDFSIPVSFEETLGVSNHYSDLAKKVMEQILKYLKTNTCCNRDTEYKNAETNNTFTIQTIRKND